MKGIGFFPGCEVPGSVRYELGALAPLLEGFWAEGSWARRNAVHLQCISPRHSLGTWECTAFRGAILIFLFFSVGTEAAVGEMRERAAVGQCDPQARARCKGVGGEWRSSQVKCNALWRPGGEKQKTGRRRATWVKGGME